MRGATRQVLSNPGASAHCRGAHPSRMGAAQRRWGSRAVLHAMPGGKRAEQCGGGQWSRSCLGRPQGGRCEEGQGGRLYSERPCDFGCMGGRKSEGGWARACDVVAAGCTEHAETGAPAPTAALGHTMGARHKACAMACRRQR